MATFTLPGRNHFQELLTGACLAGATGATTVAVADIAIEDELAERCRQPRCENYGLSRSCPPHVAGPVAFRKELETYSQALFFRVDVPVEVLFSSDNRELFRLLHEIAAGIEQAAVRLGYLRAKAFAGDSCKRIFCHDQSECQALSTLGKCRNPQMARPSMSGFGINVAKLLQGVGWGRGEEKFSTVDGSGKTAFVCGLVLIC